MMSKRGMVGAGVACVVCDDAECCACLGNAILFSCPNYTFVSVSFFRYASTTARVAFPKFVIAQSVVSFVSFVLSNDWAAEWNYSILKLG